MTYAERLARLVYALCWIGLALGVALLVRGAALGTLPFAARADPDTGTAGLLLGEPCAYFGGVVSQVPADSAGGWADATLRPLVEGVGRYP